MSLKEAINKDLQYKVTNMNLNNHISEYTL